MEAQACKRDQITYLLIMTKLYRLLSSLIGGCGDYGVHSLSNNKRRCDNSVDVHVCVDFLCEVESGG